MIWLTFYACNKTKTYVSIVALTPLQTQWLNHHDYSPEALLVVTNTSHDDNKVVDTDLFSCSSDKKFQNVNKLSATCTGLLSPPSAEKFTVYY
jgi:hypothetical protein